MAKKATDDAKRVWGTQVKAEDRADAFFAFDCSKPDALANPLHETARRLAAEDEAKKNGER